MDQLKRMQAIVELADSYAALSEVPIDPAISDNSAFLKMVRVKTHNWRSQHLANQ